MLDTCAEFWWSIYKDMPYVHRPDGGVNINTPPISPGYFIETLKEGFSGAEYWTYDVPGDVNDDSVILVEDKGKIAGILVGSVNREKLTGNITSCYVQRNYRGREIAEVLLSEALERFRKMGLRRSVAAPGRGKSMEVECPIHLALLQAGFAWENDWEPAAPKETYGVFLGGSLEGFRLQPEIQEKIEELRREGIIIERCERDRFPVYDLDGKEVPIHDDDHCVFVAFVNGVAVGRTFEVITWEDHERILSMVGPAVHPRYRRKGIGKVVHHLGTEEVVKHGAVGGWTATGIYNPARKIYQSVGFKYWYICFSRMTKYLR
jgi:ribosomal protein S18 acetylase RimI-like enzyme